MIVFVVWVGDMAHWFIFNAKYLIGGIAYCINIGNKRLVKPELVSEERIDGETQMSIDLADLVPEMVVYLMHKDGTFKQKLHDPLFCLAIPRVGDFMYVEHEVLEVVEVKWLPIENRIEKISVYVMEK